MHCQTIRWFCLAMLLAMAGCGDSGITADLSTVTVETVVDRNQINAGATFEVSCMVMDDQGREVETDTAFTVVPGKGVIVDGAEVTPNTPALYTVTCMLPDGSRPDETPELVLVTMKNIVAVETSLDKAEVVAGDPVAVTCTVNNAAGEPVTWETEVVVTPPEGVVVADHTLETKAIGEYQVACAAVGLPVVDETPAALSVIAGEPVLVRATIKDEQVEAGTEVPVFCTVEDANGNVLEVVAVADPQPGIDADGTTIIPRKAGEYDITCSAQDKELAGLEQISDHLTVIPGPVASLLLTPKPKKNAYKVADKIEILAQAADADGNPVDEEVEVTIEVPQGIKQTGAKYEFTKEGLFTFVGRMAPPYEEITAELTLVCDESGPDLVLFTPERAVTLTGETLIDVEGSAKDLFSPDIKLKINGASVPVDEEGLFFHHVEAAHGMNILTVEATDGFGNKSKIVQSFYFSSGYVDYLTENIESVMLEQALLLFLGHNFLDDGVHDYQDLDDVATLVELLLASIDFNAILPPDQPVLDTVMKDLINLPLLNQMGFQLSLTGDLGIRIFIEEISFTQPYVGINTRDGGIDMTISFIGPADDPGVYVQLLVELDFALTVKSKFGGNDLLSVGIAPGVVLQSSFGLEMLLVETSIDIAKEVGGPLQIAVTNLNIVPTGFHIEPLKEDTALVLGSIYINGQGLIDLGTINLGQLGFMQTINDFISNNLIGPLLDFLVPTVLDLLEPIIEDQVTKMLGDLLSQFELELPIPIPALPGATQEIELSFKTRLSSVLFSAAGGDLGMATGFMAPKGIEKSVLGSILRNNCGGEAQGKPAFDAEEKFEFAALLDMVNELFFSLWWSGGLTLSLDETVLGNVDVGSFGISDLAVDVDFLLPPILDDCTAKGMVEVQIGDLLVTANFKVVGAPMKVSMYVSAALDAVIFGDGNEIGLHINGITEIGTQIVEVEGNLGLLLGGLDIEALVEGVLVPMIVEQVSNLSLGSFPIPEIDLGGLLPGIPPGTTLTLGGLIIEMTKGYLLFGGELM